MQQGLVLMVVGMITVFCFLVLLVCAMQLSSKFFAKFAHLFPEEAPATAKPAAAKANPATSIAIALAAIKAKRG